MSADRGRRWRRLIPALVLATVAAATAAVFFVTRDGGGTATATTTRASTTSRATTSNAVGKPPERPVFDVLYRPPAFVRRGQPVKLTYDVVCPLTAPPKAGFCTPGARFYVRRAGAGKFDAIDLPKGRPIKVTVPARYAAGIGFDYYIDIRDERGNRRVVPAGGAEAPQRAWVIVRWTTVELGRHRFGDTRGGERVISARFGAGHGQLGRLRSVGPSAFAIARDASIVVLDQINRRLAKYRGSRVTYAPIRFLGGEGDLDIGPNGTIYVLDRGAATSHVAYVRSYDAAMKPLAATRLGDDQGNVLRVGVQGALVHALPSEQWLPVGGGRELLEPAEQRARARPAQTFAGGVEVAVDAGPRETRVALFRRDRVVASWAVRSRTPLGEVQLAEPYGGGILLVLRLLSGPHAEWQVMRLLPTGAGGNFSIAPVEAADAAPRSRLRRHGATLYVLQSARNGASVVRYRLP